jgi:hypothetical protein
MNLCYRGGIGEIELVKALIESHTVGMEHGSHSAVGKESFL